MPKKIATAQTTSPDLGREDRPFYGFFSTIYLKKLSYEDSLALLTTLAETEKNENMLTHLAGKGRSQVRAIHELVKGNHRLLVTFYEFLKADTLADLSVIFMKTMNDLKPYYETFIRYLPAQQQKILHYLALAKIPQKGTDIAKNCFIATASLTKQLSELQRRHLIDALPDPTDKRNKLYDVSEPLLRIAIEIGEQREGITSLFIDFLALYYSHDEIKSQKARFEDLYLSEVEPLKKQKLYWEVEARERALKVQVELGTGQKNVLDKFQEYMESGSTQATQGNYVQAIQLYLKAVKLNPNSEDAWYNLGVVYIDKGDNDQAVQAFQEAVRLNSDDVALWENLGLAYHNQGIYEKAIEALQKAIQLNPNDSVLWNSLGINYGRQDNNERAATFFLKAIDIRPNYGHAWYNIGVVYGRQGFHDQALNAFKEAVRLAPNDATSWYNIGVAYNKLGDNSQAIKAYEKSIELTSSDSFDAQDYEGLYEAVTEHLQTHTITEFELTDLEKWLQGRVGFEIASSYVTTYRRVIFDNDERALYDLPKEQRVFFEREILKRPAA